jgi:hypothetical protein
MGRRRTKNLDLPPRMYLRGSTYYYVAADKKWHRLGQDKARALRLWAELECVPLHVSVADVVSRYLTDCMRDSAPSTRDRYADYSRTIETKFGMLPADDLTPFAWREAAALAQRDGIPREPTPEMYEAIIAALKYDEHFANKGTGTTYGSCARHYWQAGFDAAPTGIPRDEDASDPKETT